MQEGDETDRLIGWAEEPPIPGQTVSGVVRHIDLEGGFYGIVTEDGRRLDPVNLPDAFKRDGLPVRVRVEKTREQASIRMWGELVRIVEIQRA